ncbi:hypothetical protein M514_14736 [Trichuris suis]|uniref:Uncharacterized protein n=1 Tax=Trichuris suis TaxID=68888 RepID=A0A085NTN6_9BILA|nr:hypothetical protein M514_14736 [Trichuris suis]
MAAAIDWPGIMDSFEAWVHPRTNISDLTKFVYVRTRSTWNALDAIKGYNDKGANHVVAVTTLKITFGKPRLISEKHVLELTATKTCSQQTAVDPQHLHNTLAGSMRSLVALTKRTLSGAVVLLAVLKQKLLDVVRKRRENKLLGDVERNSL